MENLKINLYLSSPLFIDRFCTIDSILVNLYVKKTFGKNIELEKLYDFDFLEKTKDGYSGSIWYVEKDAKIFLENHSYVKKPDYDYLNSNIDKVKKFSAGTGEFKAYLIWQEVMSVDKIYFYARGDKKAIEELLKDLKYVGKKSSIGFGKIDKIEIESINEDKSVFLSKNSPSRPLSLKNFSIENNRVAYFNAKVPYWLNSNYELCYLPNSSLVESDYTLNKPLINIEQKYRDSYISATSFVYNILNKNTINWQELSLESKAKKGDLVIEKDSVNEYICALTGEKSRSGLLTKSVKRILGLNFTDYGFLNKSSFISKSALWTIQNGATNRLGKSVLGGHLIDKNGIVFLMGKNKSKSIKESIEEASFPLNIALKTTSNNQHLVFKSKISFSPDLLSLQYGNNTFYFGYDEATECLEEVKEIIEKYPLTKSHLIQFPQIRDSFPKLRASAKKDEIYELLSDFYRRYSKDVRAGAFLLSME